VGLAVDVAVSEGVAVAVGVELGVAVSVGVGKGDNGKFQAEFARNVLTATRNEALWYPTALASSVMDTHWLT